MQYAKTYMMAHVLIRADASSDTLTVICMYLNITGYMRMYIYACIE